MMDGKRICSLCREIKPKTDFRFMRRQNRCNYYCKECERWYNTMYKRGKREVRKTK